MAAPLLAQTIELPVRHSHAIGSCAGALVLNSDGLSFDHAPDKGKRHHFSWAWANIQQLDLVRDRIVVTSYRDRALMFGADQRFEFVFTETPDVRALYSALAARMDQRLTARVALPPAKPLYRVNVKRLRKIHPVEGELVVEASRVLFIATAPGESRVWRNSDLINVSSSNPFSLSVATYERGGDFDFQLKQALDTAQYDALWKRLNRPRGLELISTQMEQTHQ